MTKENCVVACCWAENGLDGERNKEAQMIELKKKTDAAVAANGKRNDVEKSSENSFVDAEEI